MIVVDTSALVAMLDGEPEADAMSACALRAGRVAISSGTALELFIVVSSRWKEDGLPRLEALLSELNVVFHEVDEVLARIGLGAYARYGRGSGNPARLNFGDCFAYALAKSLDAPLLFKGDDFVHTDIRPALAA